jgi:hypothetical protein
MAHSDVLIFLNSITWIFFLFLLVYFFFVLFFLPSFYKKVRIRSLVREFNTRGVFLEALDSLSNSYVFFENFKLFVLDLLGLVFLKFLAVGSMKVSSSLFDFFGNAAVSSSEFFVRFTEVNLYTFSKVFGHKSDQGICVFISSPKNIGLSARKLG